MKKLVLSGQINKEEITNLLFNLGVIKNDKFTTVDMSNQYFKYLGAAPKAIYDACNEFADSLIFIDKIYECADMTKGKDVRSTKDVIATLLSLDGKCLVIFTGEKDKLDSFFAANPFLKD